MNAPRQPVQPVTPTEQQQADEYQRDAIASAQSLMPDEDPAEDLG